METTELPAINEKELIPIVNKELEGLIALSWVVSHEEWRDKIHINRSFLGRYNLEAARCEEILDAYQVQQNSFWHPFRKIVAVIKHFTRIAYNLLHVRFTAPSYNLLKVKGDFFLTTDMVINSISDGLITNGENLVHQAKRMILFDEDAICNYIEGLHFEESPVRCRVRSNRSKNRSERPMQRVVTLATSYLHASQEEDIILKLHKISERKKYASYFPENVNEENLMALASRFHSLQTLYDTDLSGNDIADKDSRLPILRGQISVVFHLLETASFLLHYLERHSNYFNRSRMEEPLSKSDIHIIIFEYFLAFSGRYVSAAQELCRDIIADYSEKGKIEVPVPSFRGFHVRPSSLVSRIVMHYGSDVVMRLDDDVYDASISLDIFRANEKINANKRRAIIQYAMEEPLVQENMNVKLTEEKARELCRQIIYNLTIERKAILYDSRFSLDNTSLESDETLLNYISRVLQDLMAIGKIDAKTELTVFFEGDTRVLHDLEILAQNTYGEDSHGNNIILPQELSYLAKARLPKRAS